jgi:hypothetical protein
MPDVFYRFDDEPTGNRGHTYARRTLFLGVPRRAGTRGAVSVHLDLTPLEDLAGAAIALAKKPVPPAAAAYVTAPAAAHPSAGVPGRLREFDCGSVVSTPPANTGLIPEIIGTYLIKIVTPGMLGAPGAANAMDPDMLRDIVLQVGYRLAATGGWISVRPTAVPPE